MILAKLGQYLKEHSTVSRRDLGKKFSISDDGVDAMLEVWIRKGRVSRLVDKKRNEVSYHWVQHNEIQLNVIA
ncbi:FeoC-like transcriptional regulator [Vibrio tapetis subsp. quintayensis]|uniref:FeoC-like transcriptional regulator n=1 Tax=Vibrio tapetis TaxID=52443 RepID=UPI0025B5B238|nr:FeoC-like transcriptional regulator [Vibrio tapetis]MDN3682168.1 FeoC-like transcriptional regulator [Vibrio tapetis subsp. quintayensis]